MKITGCTDCPFNVEDYDDFAMGFDTVSFCNLARHQQKKEHIISVFDRGDESVSKQTPEWCPLKEGSLELTLAQ